MAADQKLPTVYRIGDDPRDYLCFRVSDHGVDGLILSLIPNGDEQHPMDVTAIKADDPKLAARLYGSQ